MQRWRLHNQFAFVPVGFVWYLFQPENEKSPENLGFSNGAGEGIRTLDPDLGKVVLYP